MVTIIWLCAGAVIFATLIMTAIGVHALYMQGVWLRRLAELDQRMRPPAPPAPAEPPAPPPAA